LRAPDPAKGAKRRNQINGFQNVRLALRVIPQKKMKTRGKISIQPRVIAEITKP